MAFGIDIDFNAQVGKLSSQVDKISQDLGRFEQKAQQVTSAINTSFAALGTGLSVAAFTGWIKGGIDAADALSKLSTRTGIAVESLTGLKLAAELSDTNINTLGRSVNRLSINIAQNREEFAKLGISAKDPTEAFLQFADVFSSIENAQDRAAFGAKVLGKSYADLAPLLAQGSTAIRAQVQQGRELSGLTQEQADKAALFNDQLSIFQTRLAGLNTAIVSQIIEPLTRTSLIFSENIEKTGILRGAWLGLLDTFKESVGLKTGLEGEIDVIDRRINKIRESLKDLQGGTGFGSQLMPAKEKELNDLLNQRFEIVKKISAERAGPDTSTATPPPKPEDVQSFIKGGEGAAKEEETAKKQTEAEKQRQEILREGIRLTEQMRTPVEKLAAEQAKYKSLLDSGAISLGTYTKAMQSANDATLNMLGSNEELSGSEQFRQKSEADSLKIRLEQQRLDIINQRVTPDNEKPFQNLAQTPQIDEDGIKSQLEKAVNNPEQPLKMKIQIDAETLTKNLTSAVDLAQQQIQPIVIPVAYEIIDDGTGQSGNVAQQLNRQALARGRR